MCSAPASWSHQQRASTCSAHAWRQRSRSLARSVSQARRSRVRDECVAGEKAKHEPIKGYTNSGTALGLKTLYLCISKLIAAPAATFCPAGGYCLTMTPRTPESFPSAEGAATLRTLPTVNPASSNASAASARVLPTKLGITYLGALLEAEKTRLTLGVVASLPFGGGLWATTVSGGVPGIRSLDTEPISKPWRLMLMSAACSLCPIRFGMAARCGPSLSAPRTFHPRPTGVSVSGTWETTWP